VQIDIWVPLFNLAIEYQGEHHFHEIRGFGPSGTLALYTSRDQLKTRLAADQNVNFITIPYWWDGEMSSLAATLHMHFPTIFTAVASGTPIPEKI